MNASASRRLGALLLLVAAACADPRAPRLEAEADPGAEVTVDGLRRVRDSGFAQAWIKPGVDFRTYSKVMLGPVHVAYKRAPRSRGLAAQRGDFALTDKQMETFKRYLLEALQKAFSRSQYFSLVHEGGTSVIAIDTSIIDLVVNASPDPAGRNRNYNTSTAEMSLLMEIRDSETNELLARVAERREARSAGAGINQLYRSNAVTDSAAIRQTFKRWAGILQKGLDQLHQIGSPASN